MSSWSGGPTWDRGRTRPTDACGERSANRAEISGSDLAIGDGATLFEPNEDKSYHVHELVFPLESGLPFKPHNVSMLTSLYTRIPLSIGARSPSASVFRCRSIITSHNTISTGERPTKGRRRPSRGGQNLSERYKRLENSLRGKDALSRDLLKRSTNATSESFPTKTGKADTLSSKTTETFYGFQVPYEPKPPADDECCMSGCAVCVYDLYEDAFEEYIAAVKSLATSLTSLKVPQWEWPQHIRTKSAQVMSTPDTTQRKSTTVSAFEELERALSVKKQRQEEDVRQSLLKERHNKRTQLVGLEDDISQQGLLVNLYEGIRWILFSQR